MTRRLPVMIPVLVICLAAGRVAKRVFAVEPAPPPSPSSSTPAASATASSHQFLLAWGEQGTEEGKFNFPIGIAIDPAGEVLVTDFYNARIQRFAADGKFLASFAVAPFPGGIAVDEDGNIFVAHGGLPPSKYEKPRERDKIAVYSPAGKLLRDWGQFGAADGQFSLPGGIAIHNGRVYVADQCNRRVQVFDPQGAFLGKWGKQGFAPGEFGGNPHPLAFFAGPTFIAIDAAGSVFTTEAPLCRIQQFTADGGPLAAWGSTAEAAGSFGEYFTAFKIKNMRGPTGICFDDQNRLWIASIGGRVQQFTAAGQYLTGFGGEGTEPGKFYAPHGVAIDRHGSLYVVDSFNHRIQKFAVSR